MSVLQGWERTPFIQGQATKGVGADCIGFIAGVMDELYGIQTAADLPREGLLKSLNKGDSNISILRYCRRAWPSLVAGNTEEGVVDVEPGDIIVTRLGKGIGHIYIVGPVFNTVWHCGQGVGVCWTGLGVTRNQEIPGVFRLLGKDQWASK